MNKGKHTAQTVDEMTYQMEEAKTQGLASRPGQSIYKAQSGEYQSGQLKALISQNLYELSELATRERVSLENIDEVKKRTIIYLKACEETSTFPTSLGLARSMGYTSRSLRNWRNMRPKSATAIWLEQFCDMCAEIMSQSALKNNCNVIMSIFLNKALYEMRETSEFIISPRTADVEEEEFDVMRVIRQFHPEHWKLSDDELKQKFPEWFSDK